MVNFGPAEMPARFRRARRQMVTGESSRPASAEQRLKELGVQLPAPPERHLMAASNQIFQPSTPAVGFLRRLRAAEIPDSYWWNRSSPLQPECERTPKADDDSSSRRY
jgi:hypothetical protein